MAYLKVWIHFVWSTKNREKLLTKNIRPKIFNHIKENAKSKDIYVDFINGHLEHTHCLISLVKDQTIAKIAQLLKGESSFWINKNKLCKSKFEWQDEYFAVSVGESQVNRVRNYIKNQEEHHRKKSFQEEYDEFFKKYNFKKFKD